MTKKKTKVLLAKVGLDPHDKGVKLVARSLRDEGGMDIIYKGLYQTVEAVGEEALRNAVDVVGISVHCGSHMAIFSKLRTDLDRRGGKDIILIGGGVMPGQDINTLKACGTVAEIFGPSSSTGTIIEWIDGKIKEEYHR